MTIPAVNLRRFFCLSTSIFTLIVMPSIASAQQVAKPVTLVAQATAGSPFQNETVTDFSKFVPGPATRNLRLDYGIWDEALRNVVLDLGPSLRIRALRPNATVGSRMVKGHKSAYRLEGSRVTFAYINDEYREGLTNYRKDLEDIGSRIPLTNLSRDEQLVYWFNLHNVALIEQIANAYPIDRPENIKVRIDGEKVKLDDAKFISVKGEMLSLSDIRRNIVYANWSEPEVIYGFFRGNIGSPKMPRVAYTATSLEYQLNDNADEFVNSLRGFHEASRTRQVSSIYEEARPYFFQNWEQDLTAHLRKHAVRDTIAEVNSSKPIRVDRYDAMIADLSGGRRLASSGSPIQTPGRPGSSMSLETQRLLNEVREKQRDLRAKGITQQRGGYVIIEDLVPSETVTEEIPITTPEE